MFETSFLDKLVKRYNYDNKIIKALSTIIPELINFYGEHQEETILNAIYNCEIIPCDSHSTITKVLNSRKLTKTVGSSPVGDIDIKRAESVYMPNIKLSYNDKNNSYQIDKIDRVIVTSHTFNYDSLKGIEVLTHALCHLIKSYSNEITIDENILTIRSGISYEKRKINYNNGEITLDFIEDYGKALEEGFTLYDTEEIVSKASRDKYKCYDFDSIYIIALIMKDKYKLKTEINDYEVSGSIEEFKSKYKEENIDKLTGICDDCFQLENEMFLSYTRDNKNKLASLINKKLSDEAYEPLISIYKSKNIVENVK